MAAMASELSGNTPSLLTKNRRLQVLYPEDGTTPTPLDQKPLPCPVCGVTGRVSVTRSELGGGGLPS